MMMHRVGQREFIASRDDFDEAVRRTPDIASFCSSSAWCLAARAHLLDLGADEEETADGQTGRTLPAPAVAGETRIWRDEDADHWLLFGRSPWGYWQPFEAAWMFACPVIGPEPEESLKRLRELVAGDADLTPGLAIGGVTRDSRLHRTLRQMDADGHLRHYREFPATDSLAIDLKAGAETWLGRRSRKFRRSLQSSQRRCREAGLAVEVIEGGPGIDSAVFDRLLAVQTRTAKWASGTDIFQAERYRRFYRQIFEDLRLAGRLRILIATRDGEDIAHIFGGVFGDEYRGLQMSYVSEVSSLGAGNWLQWENLRRRDAEGIARYDLGMDSEYKRRWADEHRSQVIGFVVP